MSFTKNLKKDKTCIICRIETKNWVKGDQVVVVSMEKKNHATSTYSVKHRHIYTSYSTANMLKKDTHQRNVISFTPAPVENLKAKNKIFVNIS